MEKIFSTDVVFKIGGIIAGIAILGYANYYSVKFIKQNLQTFIRDTNKKIDKLFTYSDDIKVKHERCRVEIDHLKESYEKIEERCYERYTKS